MAFPALLVDVAFTVGASTSTYLHLDDATRGLLDTGTLAPDVVWTDVTSYVHSVTVRRGANRVESPIIRYDATTIQVVLNNSDRRFDPTNLAGPYVAAGVTQVTPMRLMRVRATHGSTTYEIARGYADGWQVDYEPSGNYSSVTLAATDGVKVLSRRTRTAVAAVGAGEDSGARVTRILNSIGWDTADRNLDVGDSTLQATTLDGDAWTELQSVQDSEIGEIYVDAGGRVAFRARHAILEDTRSNTSQATFGDGGGAELPYESVTIDYDDASLYTRVVATRDGGAAQTADDTTAQAQYLILPFDASGLLLQSDAVTAEWASFVLGQTATPELRFSTLVVNPRNNDATVETNLFTQILAREIGDRVTIIRRPPGGGSAIQRDVFIRGIGHDIGPVTWRTEWALQSASRFEYLLLDSSVLGLLDTDRLAF